MDGCYLAKTLEASGALCTTQWSRVPWIGNTVISFLLSLQNALMKFLFHWLYRHVYILQNNKPHDFTQEGEMKLKLKIIQLFKLDLQRAIDFYNQLFIK